MALTDRATPGRHRWMRLVAAGTAIAAIAAGAFVAGRSGDGGSAEVSTSGAGPGWEAVSAPPLPSTEGPVLAWTGRELVLFGGDRARNSREVDMSDEGAAYDPTTGTWRLLAESPFDALYGVAGVWTDDRLVVAGTPCPEEVPGDSSATPDCEPGGVVAAMYDPEADAWETVAGPDDQAFRDATGAIAHGATGDAAVFEIGASLWRISPASGQWQRLPGPPLDQREVLCSSATGVTAVAVAERSQASSAEGAAPPDFSRTPATMRASTLARGASRWSDVAETGSGQAPLVSVGICAGDSVLTLPAADGEMERTAGLGRYDARSGAWHQMAPAPVAINTRPGNTWTGAEVVVFGIRETATYRPTTDEWRVVRTPPPAEVLDAVWVGDRVVALAKDAESAEAAPSLRALTIE